MISVVDLNGRVVSSEPSRRPFQPLLSHTGKLDLCTPAAHQEVTKCIWICACICICISVFVFFGQAAAAAAWVLNELFCDKDKFWNARIYISLTPS